MKLSSFITKFIESHGFQIMAQAFTITGLLLAAYITARLAPILSRLDKLEIRVEASETKFDYVANSIDKRLERIENYVIPKPSK